jgi:Rps23 Pro-64 3,4-dihydroxylase Tpa1-like proline 4-hydroxylase
VLSLLHVGLFERVPEIQRRYGTAQPFRHVVIDEFLKAEFCRELMAEFPSFDATHAVNERGETGRKAVVADVARLGEAYARFDQMIRGREFLDLMSRITGIPKLLYDPEYVGGGTHENLDGQDLDPHVDFNYHPSRQWHRRLNLIVFLNPEWEGEWGGCLELLEDPWTANGAGEAIVPIANRAVIFETNERSWHGFHRIQLPAEKARISRRSLAIYLYTKERPAEETASSHGTVYVQRQLGEHVQPGYSLREEDVEEIRSLIERRDAQIRFLYERELEFSALVSGLTRSPSFRLGRALTWPARAVRRLFGSR